MNDLEIIELLQKHDSQGIQLFLERYTPLIRYVIAPILPNVQDQEDCISAITTRVWEKASLYDTKKGQFTSWLTVLARNTALNQARKNNETTSELTDSVPSAAPTPEELVLTQEELLRLKHAVNLLLPTDRQIFYRKYYYLQSTAQIASELGMTERAVEGRLYRIKKKLRKLLGGE